MTPAEWNRVARRLQALQFEMQAIQLQVAATALRATNVHSRIAELEHAQEEA